MGNKQIWKLFNAIIFLNFIFKILSKEKKKYVFWNEIWMHVKDV